MDFTEHFLSDAADILRALDREAIDAVVALVADTKRRRGRVFFLGCGGGAGNATHAVNDFRLLARIPAFTPTDNAAELTARINDDGWDTSYRNWLQAFQPTPDDLVFVFSVGGGSLEHGLSVNIVRALELASECGTRITGVVGRDGGATARLADACVLVPTVSADTVTVHTESVQALILHLLVAHPAINGRTMRWESTQRAAEEPTDG